MVRKQINPAAEEFLQGLLEFNQLKGVRASLPFHKEINVAALAVLPPGHGAKNSHLR